MNEIIRWEYRVQTVGGLLVPVKDEDVQAMLNEWGSDGWELVTATNIEGTNKVRIVARRPLTAGARRSQASWPS